MALELVVSEEKLLLERKSEGTANKIDTKDLSPVSLFGFVCLPILF